MVVIKLHIHNFESIIPIKAIVNTNFGMDGLSVVEKYFCNQATR
jgi:hypothetical protein